MKCMKESNSPYGFNGNITLQPRSKMNAEYLRILNITRKYREITPKKWLNYRGPWLEDDWIARFCGEPIDSFGPFIPLFINWFNIFRQKKKEYFNLTQKIFGMLSPEFIYITVSTNDHGIEGRKFIEKDFPIPPNLLIISASGKGHVPCLLHLPVDRDPVDILPQEYPMVFMGKLVKMPRINIVYQTTQHLGRYFLNNRTSDWIESYSKAGLIMSPRGNARGCFRTSEILQMGMVPVLVFDDHPWVPYARSGLPWKDIGFVYLINEIPEMAKMARQISQKRLEFMRTVILKYRESHFTMKGTLHQIEMFMKYGFYMSDLRCDYYYNNT